MKPKELNPMVQGLQDQTSGLVASRNEGGPNTLIQQSGHISLTGTRYQEKDSGSGPYQMVRGGREISCSEKILPDTGTSRESRVGPEENSPLLHQEGTVGGRLPTAGGDVTPRQN